MHQLTMSGKVMAELIRPKKASWFWRLRNFPRVWDGWWKHLIASSLSPTLYGELRALLVRANGDVVDYGLVSTHLVTDAFVTALATYMYDGSGVAPTAYDYHDSGTGTGNEAAGDTALGTATGIARASGTASNPSAGVYRSVATINYNNTFAVTEHGLFSASSSGTLLDRSKFTAINVVNGDSIQFTYSLTISSGG